MAQRDMGILQGTALMLSIIIGAGLFSVPGLSYAQADAQALYSWILVAIAFLPFVFLYAWIGQRFPSLGGAVSLCEAGLKGPGKFLATAFFLGAVLFGLPGIALTAGHYIARILPIPAAVTALALLALVAVPFVMGRQAVFAFTRRSLAFILAALAVILAAALMVGPGRGLSWPAPDPARIVMPFMLIYFSFTGWELALSLAGEYRRPERDFPLSIYLSFAVVVLLYLFLVYVIAVSTETPASAAQGASAFHDVVTLVFGRYGGVVLVALIGLTIVTNLAGALWSLSRMLQSFCAEEGIAALAGINGRGVAMPAFLALHGPMMAVLLLSVAGVLDIGFLIDLSGSVFFAINMLILLSVLRLVEGPWLRLAVLFMIGGNVAVFLWAARMENVAYIALLAGLAVAFHRLAGSRRERARERG